MERHHIEKVIFGSFDGLTSALGVVAGLVAAHVTSGPHILAAAIGLAVAATIGMGAGQYLSEDHPLFHHAVIMGFATLGGSLLPALPFIFGFKLATVIASGLLTIGAASIIACFRGFKLTFGVLTLTAVITVLLSMVVA